VELKKQVKAFTSAERREIVIYSSTVLSEFGGAEMCFDMKSIDTVQLLIGSCEMLVE